MAGDERGIGMARVSMSLRFERKGNDRFFCVDFMVYIEEFNQLYIGAIFYF